MINVEASFSAYRRQYEQPLWRQGLELVGIPDLKVFSQALSDPDTAKLWQNDTVLPLLSDIKHLSLPTYNWLNPAFYKKLAGREIPIKHYSHLPDLLASNPQAYSDALSQTVRSLADQRGLMVFEHTDQETASIDQGILRLAGYLGEIGVGLKDLLAEAGVVPRHYHYISRHSPETSQTSGELSFYDIYQKGRQTGYFKADYPVTVEPRLSQADANYVWEFYEPAHDKLSDVDAVNAGFTKDELSEIFDSEDFVKLVYRAGGRIVNLCVITDVKNCYWMNRDYYRQNFPVAYDKKRIVFGIGLLSDHAAAEKPKAASLRTLALMGDIVRRDGGEAVFSLVCNNVSNQYVPSLTEQALNSAGMRVDFSQPIGHHIFRAFELSPL